MLTQSQFIPVKCKVRRLSRSPSANMSSPVKRLYDRSRLIRLGNMAGWILMLLLILFKGNSSSWRAENLLKASITKKLKISSMNLIWQEEVETALNKYIGFIVFVQVINTFSTCSYMIFQIYFLFEYFSNKNQNLTSCIREFIFSCK